MNCRQSSFEQRASAARFFLLLFGISELVRGHYNSVVLVVWWGVACRSDSLFLDLVIHFFDHSHEGPFDIASCKCGGFEIEHLVFLRKFGGFLQFNRPFIFLVTFVS